jgi:hypothetical protein
LLLDADVGDASDVTEILQYGRGHLPISRNVGSVDLDIDRGGQTEIQCLSHDVPG